jgi:outer membrane biosynthesis protein TonB
MTRGDLRTVILIVCTAIISSVGTAIVAHLLIAPHHDRTRELEARVTTLETRPVPPPPPAPAPPAPPPVVIQPPDPTPCDEVSCVLENYEPTCCAQFRKSLQEDSLDRSMISAGVSDIIKARIAACGDRSSAKGKVKVSVKVAPDGSVRNVTVRETPDESLGRCVAAEMQHAHFAKTKYGGSFGYPFIF